jgi:hypothetical protein
METPPQLLRLRHWTDWSQRPLRDDIRGTYSPSHGSARTCIPQRSACPSRKRMTQRSLRIFPWPISGQQVRSPELALPPRGTPRDFHHESCRRETYDFELHTSNRSPSQRHTKQMTWPPLSFLCPYRPMTFTALQLQRNGEDMALTGMTWSSFPVG